MANSIQFPTVMLPAVILDFIITHFSLTQCLEALWLKKSKEHMSVVMSNDFFSLLAGSLRSLSGL